MLFFNRVKINREVLSFVLATLFVTLCFVWIYANYGIYYSSDDVGIMKTFSGYTSGTPTAYHAYGSYTLGLFFKALYTIMPGLNWYSYGSILVVIVSNVVIIYSIYRQRDSKEKKLQYVDLLLIGVLTVAISLCGISRITWTTNAALAAVAGIMCLLILPDVNGKKWLVYGAAVMFFAISSLIRNASYKAVLPFALLALMYQTGKDMHIDSRKEKMKTLFSDVLLVVILISILAYIKVDVALKSDVFQSETGTFEYYRGLYTDTYHIPYEGNEDFYDSLGWDEEFYNMTNDWFFIDPRFNTENLKLIAEKSQEIRRQSTNDNNIYSYKDEFLDETKNKPMRILMTISVVVLFFVGVGMTMHQFIKKREWSDWIFLAGTELLAMAEWGYLVMERGRFIDRAFYCTVFPALFIGLWILSRHAEAMSKHKVFYFAVGVLAIFSIYIAGKQMFNHGDLARLEGLSRRSVDSDEITMTHPDIFYITDTSMAGGVFLFLNMDWAGCGNNRLMWGGTGVFSQSFFEKIAQFGYDEFYSDNLFDENVYFMTSYSAIDNTDFMAYMKKTYGDTVVAKLVDTTESGVYVYDFDR